MAHQTDVHVVHQKIESDHPNEKVVDPVCGKTIERRESKNMVFRGEATYYFCSRECKERYISPEFWRKRAA